MSDYLDVAVRAYPHRIAKRRRRTTDRPPELVVVLDTETTVDAAQRLLFGSYRMYAVEPEGAYCTLRCVEEGLIHADDLEQRDPLGLEVLRAYALREPPAVDRGLPDAAWSLRLRSQRQFNDEIVRRVVFEGRARLVCFNFPFDLSRLARDWGETKREPGEFWLSLCEYEHGGCFHENRYAPRLGIRTIDSKRALLRFRSPRATERVDRIPEGSSSGRSRAGYVFEGRLLDLRAFVFALTGQGHSLESACEAFDVPFKKRDVHHGRIAAEYIAYNREDVAATAALYTHTIEEFGRHPIDLAPEHCYSPASLGKAYLRAFGIRPPRERHAEIPPALLGFAASAYYGGRAECRIRRTPVPVITCDFLSMYPTVCTLLRLWPLLTCNRIEAVEVPPEEMQRWLERTSLDDCFDPETWTDLAALVLIEPDGDLLPVRARYGASNLGIGLNWLVGSPEPLWYTLPDALAARQLGGKTPTIVRAVRFRPKGKARTLRPLALHGSLAIDPHADDFFRAVIEERQRLKRGGERSDQERRRLDRFLKVIANATSYGIFAEINRQELPASRRVATDVFGLEPFTCSEASPETPGEFFFSPFAALIAGGARLMLALLELLVSDAGGSYLNCDTDAMAIVGSARGGLVACPGGRERLPDGRAAIRALSSAQVARIISRFGSLNPYDTRAVPGSILELENENFDPCTGKRRQLYGYAIAAKRYCLFNLTRSGEPVLRKRMEHGLGHLLNPTAADSDDRDWIGQLWEYVVRVDALGLEAQVPEWLGAPALTQTTISRPNTLAAFAEHNADKLIGDRVRPFNFLLAAHVAPGGHPNGADPTCFQLVAPYARDQRQWRKRTWFDLHTGDRYRITTHGSGGDGIARVNTYRDILDRYRIHPEAKSCDAQREPCGPTTTGLLHRRAVNARLLTHVGKESNRLEDVQAGLTHDVDDVLTEYDSGTHGGWRTLVHPVLCDMPVALAARDSGISRRGIEKLRANPQQRPHAKTMQAVTLAAAEYARSALAAAGIQASAAALDCLAVYRDWRSSLPRRACEGCGQMLSGRQHRWCGDCASKRFERDRSTGRGDEATSARASRPTRSQAA